MATFSSGVKCFRSFLIRSLRYLNGRTLSPFPAEAGHAQRSTSAARRHGTRHTGGRFERRAGHRRCRTILASRWRAMYGPHCGRFYGVFSPRLRKGRVKFQSASRFNREYSSFNRDEDQVLRFGGVLEVSPLLESGRPVLWPHPKGDSEASEDRGGINLQRGFLKDHQVQEQQACHGA